MNFGFLSLELLELILNFDIYKWLSLCIVLLYWIL